MVRQKILIIEDDADTRRGLELRLRHSGYDVVSAADAVTAITVARRTVPDLVILDLGLPGGDGFTVIEQLRALNSTAPIPIIVLSARDPGVHRERALKAGAAAFLQKPVDNAELLAAIMLQLGANRERASRKKILLIEDDADARQGLSIRLKASGYDTFFAEDGATALTTANRELPDLILLDLGLPGGDGFVLLERLRTHNSLSNIPVIVLSARDPAIHKGRALNLGARAFFQKPAENEELLAAIQDALRG